MLSAHSIKCTHGRANALHWHRFNNMKRESILGPHFGIEFRCRLHINSWSFSWEKCFKWITCLCQDTDREMWWRWWKPILRSNNTNKQWSFKNEHLYGFNSILRLNCMLDACVYVGFSKYNINVSLVKQLNFINAKIDKSIWARRFMLILKSIHCLNCYCYTNDTEIDFWSVDRFFFFWSENWMSGHSVTECNTQIRSDLTQFA